MGFRIEDCYRKRTNGLTPLPFFIYSMAVLIFLLNTWPYMHTPTTLISRHGLKLNFTLAGISFRTPFSVIKCNSFSATSLIRKLNELKVKTPCILYIKLRLGMRSRFRVLVLSLPKFICRQILWEINNMKQYEGKAVFAWFFSYLSPLFSHLIVSTYQLETRVDES